MCEENLLFTTPQEFWSDSHVHITGGLIETLSDEEIETGLKAIEIMLEQGETAHKVQKTIET